MDKLATLDARDRLDLFRETAAKMGVARAALMEKDFWVCFTLKRLFSIESLRGKMVFKGGTSLSKAYNTISRFSEDIDLTLDRRLIGIAGNTDFDDEMGRNKRERLIKEMTISSSQFITNELRQMLKESIKNILGQDGTWRLDIEENENVPSQVLLFHYPKAGVEAQAITEYIKIEMGMKGELEPAATHKIMPYAAKFFDTQFSDPIAHVDTLSAERTFWEKATILHAWANRDLSKKAPQNYSRHYYDLAKLSGSAYRKTALERLDILKKVASNKDRFFRAGWAKYSEAKPGTLKLVPPKTRAEQLEKDYEDTKEMIFDKVPEFSEILSILNQLQSDINALR